MCAEVIMCAGRPTVAVDPAVELNPAHMTDSQQSQPVTMLVQMLGEIKAMHWEVLHAQTERQTQLLEHLLSRSGAGWPASPPLLLSSITLHMMSPADNPQPDLPGDV